MQSHPYSCLTCSLAFTSSTAQRGHYSSDLHRYNAKRKVAELPAVSAEVFNEKIADRREKLAAVTVRSGAGDVVSSGRKDGSAEKRLECKACNKTFSSQNAHDDHLKSRKHRERVMQGVANIKVGKEQASAESDSSEDQTEAQPVVEEAPAATTSSASASATAPEYKPTSCLFCPRSFSSVEINLKHMSRNHAFYIPDLAWCVNVPGLLQQLGEDVTLGNICLFCGHGFGGLVTGSEADAELVKRAKRGSEAVRKHMVDKNHCRLPWDTEEQRLAYSDHYDYSSSYPDQLNSDGEMEVDAAQNEEWEDEDGSEIDDNDAVVVDYSAIRRKTRKPMEQDLDYRLQVGDADYELVLPSGVRIGHRALKGIYKQNMMPYINLDEPKDKLSRLTANMNAREERKQVNSSALVARGNGQEMVVARNKGEAKNARRADTHFLENKAYQRQSQRVGKAKNNQQFFRDPLLQ